MGTGPSPAGQLTPIGKSLHPVFTSRVEEHPGTCDDFDCMPLSEHEQRILRQIEQELASDPTFADRASRISRRRLFVLSLCVVVGLTVTVAGLAVNYWLAFAAFIGVLVLSSMLERELRLVSRDKLSNLPINAWLTGGTRNRRRNSDS
jgi:hypothetical protein